jgi:hypothetical protein
MPPAPPPIEPRTFRDFMAETLELVERYSGWRPPAAGRDPGSALVHIFARMAELVTDRLNQMPDRNFLAFLDLIGLDLRPPQPARVPLTFYLAAGASEAVVPARTPVAAALLEGETEPVVFETERSLTLTPAELASVFTRDPARDRYADHTAAALDHEAAGFPVFGAETPIPHWLYLADPGFGLEGEKRITLDIEPRDAQQPWPRLLEWAYLDAEGLAQPLTARPLEVAPGGADAWRVELPAVPAVPVGRVDGQAGSWLAARLAVPLRERELPAERAVSDDLELLLDEPLHPFGRETPRTEFFLASAAVFAVPGAETTLAIALDEARPPLASEDLELVWEYWEAGAGWRELGRSSPASEPGEPADAFAFSDGTGALTRSGVVRFRNPADWEIHGVAGHMGVWLRVAVDQGGYESAGGEYRPPAVQRLRLGYDLPLPEIRSVRASVHVAEANLPVAEGFSNLVALELNADFLPFGDRPRLGDSFFLALPALAGKPGARVTLSFTLTNPRDEQAVPPPARTDGDARLRWEFWNPVRTAWEMLGEATTNPPAPPSGAFGFQDRTRALTRHEPPDEEVGTVAFDWPATAGAVEVGSENRLWLRVRLVGGNYGREARYVPSQREGGFELEPSTLQPPSIHSVHYGYTYDSTPARPEAVLAENDFVVSDHTGTEPFWPFTTWHDREPTLYLGFRRPGSELGFANRTVTLYLGVEQVPYGSVSAPRVEDPLVAWEYRRPGGWGPLMAQDETAGFTTRGLLTFIAPPDMVRAREFGEAAWWLRARLERGGYAHPPRLRRLLPNTTWAGHTVSLRDEVLGSGTGETSQRLRTTRAPVLPGQRLEVREPEIPSEAERAAILREEGRDAIRVLPDSAGRPLEVWVRWHEVPDFHASGPRSRHYTLDRLSGEIRFGDGEQGMIPPPARSNLRMALYRTGGGTQGNRPADNLTELKTTVPYVDSVTNLEPAAGGSGAETLDAVRLRGPRTLRHRDRAVTIADYEDLAREATPEVALVRGFAARGAADAGVVVLIVVPRSEAGQPVPSVELVNRVQSHVRERLTPTARLVVRGPEWKEVAVGAEIVPAVLEEAGTVRSEVIARLRTFLHPLTGGPDRLGWPFGRKPHPSDLYAVIEATPGVSHVRRLEVRETEIWSDDFLVFSGEHRIAIAGTAEP